MTAHSLPTSPRSPTPAMARIAVYVRVSTSHQVQHQTIEQQLARLLAHVRAQPGWALRDEHVFRDDGYSGARLARPGLDALRDAAKRREVDRVLVTAPDRLARNYVHQMVLLEEFAQSGCPVEFLDRPMSDDPHDQLLLQIRGAVAEYERTLIAERMRRGRLAKLQAGLLLPWTYAPYGYRLDPTRPRDPSGVTVEPAEAAIVAELFALYREPAMSLAKLAERLTARGIPTPGGQARWSCPSVRGILRNPTYTGHVYAQRTQYRPPQVRRSATHPLGHPHGTETPTPPESWLYVGAVPPLVSQAHFNEVQQKLAQNRSFARRHNTAHWYLLRALVSCGHCHLACTGRCLHGRYRYDQCNGKQQRVQAHRATRCPARYIPAAQLDALVWADLCALLREPARLTAALERAHGGAWLPQDLAARRENLRCGQAHLVQQLERLTDAYLRAVIPLAEYERRRQLLEQKHAALRAREAQLAGDATRRQALAGVAASLDAFCARVAGGLAAATFEQRRELVLLLIDRVIVTDGDVEIRYVLPTSPESEHVRFCHLRKDYFHLPPLVVERRQLAGRRHLGIEYGGDEPVERVGPLGVPDPRKLVLDPAHPQGTAILRSRVPRRSQLAQVRSIGQALDEREPGVLADPPEEIGSRGGGLLKEVEVGEDPVGHAEHPALEARDDRGGQPDLARGVGAERRGEHHVRARLHEAHQAELGKRRRSPRRARPAERASIGWRIWHAHRGPIETHQAPGAVEGARRGRRGHGVRDPLEEPLQRGFAEPLAGLGDGRLGGRGDPGAGPREPAHTLEEAAQHLAIGDLHVEGERDRVVDHHVGREVAHALALPPRLGQHRLDLVQRHRSGHRAQTDVLAQPAPGRQSCNAPSHRQLLLPTEQKLTTPGQSEQHWI